MRVSVFVFLCVGNCGHHRGDGGMRAFIRDGKEKDGSWVLILLLLLHTIFIILYDFITTDTDWLGLAVWMKWEMCKLYWKCVSSVM